MTTCMDSSRNFSYMMLNLVGEVGELASKVAKSIRKEQVFLGLDSDLHYASGFKGVYGYEEELKKEAGDVMWQLSGLCSIMGWSLEEIAEGNLAKLSARKANSTIDGNGDGVTKEERGK